MGDKIFVLNVAVKMLTFQFAIAVNSKYILTITDNKINGQCVGSPACIS